MSVSGDSIDTILRIGGVATHSLTLHPSLLAGPFKIDDRMYIVDRQEVVRRDVETIIHEAIDGVNGFPVLSIGRQMLPGWVVALDLKEVAP